jgi:hypothetical protein
MVRAGEFVMLQILLHWRSGPQQQQTIVGLESGSNRPFLCFITEVGTRLLVG